jgi:hypothetical protein
MSNNAVPPREPNVNVTVINGARINVTIVRAI